MKWNVRHKLNAGALQYAIFISILIALIVFSFISMSFLQRKLSIKSNFYKKAIENVNEGFQYAKSNEINFKEPFLLRQNSESQDSTVLFKSDWGVFELIKVFSKVGQESFQKSALLGGYHEDRSSLYLQDLNRPLVLVGNSQITGKVSLPEKGVKRGSIGGQSYYGGQMIYGYSDISHAELPNLKNRSQLLNLDRVLQKDDNVQLLRSLNIADIYRSFFEPTGLITSGQPMSLDEVRLIGNLIVQSDSLIYVSNKSVLRDVILMAPEIIIEDGVKGVFQAWASERINVGENCLLEYPSSLVLVNKGLQGKDFIENNCISVHKNSEIRGVIAYLTQEQDPQAGAQIIVEDGSIIKGELYSEMNVELEGAVFGTITTRGFVSVHNGAKYQNHILNGTINSKELPQQFAGLLFENMSKKIAKWLK